MKKIFTDFDGTKYYQNFRGDIVDENGNLLTLEVESNVRKILEQRNKRNRAQRAKNQAMKDLGLVRVRGALGGTYWE